MTCTNQPHPSKRYHSHSRATSIVLRISSYLVLTAADTPVPPPPSPPDRPGAPPRQLTPASGWQLKASPHQVPTTSLELGEASRGLAFHSVFSLPTGASFPLGLLTSNPASSVATIDDGSMWSALLEWGAARQPSPHADNTARRGSFGSCHIGPDGLSISQQSPVRYRGSPSGPQPISQDQSDLPGLASVSLTLSQ